MLSLPTEVMQHMCLALAPIDIARLAQTCRHLRDSLHDDTFWALIYKAWYSVVPVSNPHERILAFHRDTYPVSCAYRVLRHGCDVMLTSGAVVLGGKPEYHYMHIIHALEAPYTHDVILDFVINGHIDDLSQISLTLPLTMQAIDYILRLAIPETLRTEIEVLRALRLNQVPAELPPDDYIVKYDAIAAYQQYYQNISTADMLKYYLLTMSCRCPRIYSHIKRHLPAYDTDSLISVLIDNGFDYWYVAPILARDISDDQCQQLVLYLAENENEEYIDFMSHIYPYIAHRILPKTIVELMTHDNDVPDNLAYLWLQTLGIIFPLQHIRTPALQRLLALCAHNMPVDKGRLYLELYVNASRYYMSHPEAIPTLQLMFHKMAGYDRYPESNKIFDYEPLPLGNYSRFLVTSKDSILVLSSSGGSNVDATFGSSGYIDSMLVVPPSTVVLITMTGHATLNILSMTGGHLDMLPDLLIID